MDKYFDTCPTLVLILSTGCDDKSLKFWTVSLSTCHLCLPTGLVFWSGSGSALQEFLDEVTVSSLFYLKQALFIRLEGPCGFLSGMKSHGPIISNGPKSLPELVQTLHRTQVQLMQMTMRLSQLESRQNFILKGRDGRDGKDGKQGKPGRDGRDGKDGKQGPPGVNGASGQPGRDGRDGKDGKPGQKGDRGDKGPRGAQGPKGDRSGGLMYVRWGKSKCGTNSTLVYSGRMGGELYASRGGGTNYLCLPDNPKYGRFKASVQGLSGSVYGTEYEVKHFNPFTKKNLHDSDAPCAVCYVTTRNVNLMIPATNECPAGWTRDYHGYLMAASRNHHPSEFVCVDENAEAIPGSTRNKNGALLYPVEGRCGSLPCNKYINGRELTCAVCSK